MARYITRPNIILTHHISYIYCNGFEINLVLGYYLKTVTNPRVCFLLDVFLSKTPYSGLDVATTIQSHLRLKNLENLQICDLFSTLLFRNKRVSSCHFAATFAKMIKK